MQKFKNKFSHNKLARCIGLTSKDSDARIIYFIGSVQRKERVPKANNLSDRKEYVRHRLNELNTQSIAFENEHTNISFVNLVDIYLKKSELDYLNESIRYDTHRTNKTLANRISALVVELELNVAVIDVRKKHIIKLLD
jgi:hypothetical protein